MKRKRLNRDKGWGFQFFPYFQMNMDSDVFRGFVSVIFLVDGERLYWDFPKTGKGAVAGGGMVWLQMVPEGSGRLITAMLSPDCDSGGYRVSVWYVDVIDRLEFDPDGMAIYVDMYLDVIATPQGDLKIDDRDELDAAFKSGELTKNQYETALSECDSIVSELFGNTANTETEHLAVFEEAMRIIKSGECTLALNTERMK